jgi:hypothetical protein
MVVVACLLAGGCCQTANDNSGKALEAFTQNSSKGTRLGAFSM